MAATVTINDVLDGHVRLDIECLDRIYLNGYVPSLQMGGQVVSFPTQHLGNPIPSPAILEKIGIAFRRAVASFAEANRIPVVRFAGNDRKIEVMRRIWPVKRGPEGLVWPRSGWPRSSRRYTPPPNTPGTHRGCGSPSRCPSGGLPVTTFMFGTRFRACVRQGLRLLSVSDEGLAQRTRVGQAAGDQSRDQVHRAVQRVRHSHRSGRAADDLRPTRPGPRSRCSPNAGGRSCRCR
jgi:hypothetical protein